VALLVCSKSSYRAADDADPTSGFTARLPLQEVWDRNVVVDEVARLAATDGHRITVTLWDDVEYLRTEGVIALHRA